MAVRGRLSECAAIRNSWGNRSAPLTQIFPPLFDLWIPLNWSLPGSGCLCCHGRIPQLWSRKVCWWREPSPHPTVLPGVREGVAQTGLINKAAGLTSQSTRFRAGCKMLYSLRLKAPPQLPRYHAISGSPKKCVFIWLSITTSPFSERQSQSSTTTSLQDE